MLQDLYACRFLILLTNTECRNRENCIVCPFITPAKGCGFRMVSNRSWQKILKYLASMPINIMLQELY